MSSQTTDPRLEHVALALTDVAGKDSERLAGIVLYIADAHDPLRRTASNTFDQRKNYGLAP